MRAVYVAVLTAVLLVSGPGFADAFSAAGTQNVEEPKPHIVKLNRDTNVREVLDASFLEEQEMREVATLPKSSPERAARLGAITARAEQRAATNRSLVLETRNLNNIDSPTNACWYRPFWGWAGWGFITFYVIRVVYVIYYPGYWW